MFWWSEWNWCEKVEHKREANRINRVLSSEINQSNQKQHRNYINQSINQSSWIEAICPKTTTTRARIVLGAAMAPTRSRKPTIIANTCRPRMFPSLRFGIRTRTIRLLTNTNSSSLAVPLISLLVGFCYFSLSAPQFNITLYLLFIHRFYLWTF